MRILIAIPVLLVLAACNVSKDGNAVTVQYDQNTAENAAADIGNTAENIAADIGNDVSRTADKVQNKVGDNDDNDNAEANATESTDVGPTVTLGTRVWQEEGSAEGMSWSAAKDHCARLSGWELPTHDLLMAAMKADAGEHALEWRGYYWSSTPGDGGAEGMAVTSSGRRESSAQTNLFKVRCVRKSSSL